MVVKCIPYDINRFLKAERHKKNEKNIQARDDLHTHLEGYNGILQTILAIITTSPNENDKRLLNS